MSHRKVELRHRDGGRDTIYGLMNAVNFSSRDEWKSDGSGDESSTELDAYGDCRVRAGVGKGTRGLRWAVNMGHGHERGRRWGKYNV